MRIAVLISGNGSNLQAMIDACKAGRIAGELVGVISNKADAYGLQRAQDAGIHARVIANQAYASRDEYDGALIQQLDEWQVDLVILAGFMRILTPAFVQHFAGRILNIHPSLLPKYQGVKTHERAIAAGDQVHGASVHFVTDELDGGPVVLQAKVPVFSDDTPEELALGWLRYEAVRKMNPRQFGEMCKRNLGGEFFDDIVTEAVLGFKPNDKTQAPT